MVYLMSTGTKCFCANMHDHLSATYKMCSPLDADKLSNPTKYSTKLAEYDFLPRLGESLMGVVYGIRNLASRRGTQQ